MDNFLKNAQTFLSTVSHGPGVYLMRDADMVLYVGKARDLHARLSQYSHFSGPAQNKTALLLAQVRQVQTIVTHTENEALLLEAALIKRHRPKYNVVLRDDKGYPWIQVTVQEAWPRLLISRRRVEDGSRYFGPYSSGPALRESLKLLAALFPLRRCRTVYQRSRPCLNHQMQCCPAPCAGLADPQAYQAVVAELLLVLSGKQQQVVQRLQEAMHSAAAELRFEEAALYRDRIHNLNKTLEHQSIAGIGPQDQDVLGIARQDAAVALALLQVRSGTVSAVQEVFAADPLGKAQGILQQFLMQCYAAHNPPPKELLLPFLPEDPALIQRQLQEWRQGPVHFFVPQRGKKKSLLALATANAAQILASQEKRQASWEGLARSLCTDLCLATVPEHIECLDISNWAGKQAVASLVCYIEGEHVAARSRIFRIRLKDEPDDYAMMAEALQRRFSTGENFPQLLVVDGGKGQLAVALRILAEQGLRQQVAVLALAKEKQNEGEKVFLPGRSAPLPLPRHAPSLLFLMRMRDQAHHFGLKHHRKLRTQAGLRSSLDQMKGLGPKRKEQLLQSLGSYQRIQAASVDELCQVPGIGRSLAESLYQQLHSQIS